MLFKKILLVVSIIFIVNESFSKEYKHPDVYYNDALVAYQEGHLGEAMYDIKQAYLLAPNVEYIRKLFFTIRYDIGLPRIYTTDRIGSQIFANIFLARAPYINVLIGGILFLIASVLVSLRLLGKLYYGKGVLGIIGLCFGVGILFMSQATIYYYAFFNSDQRVVLQKSQTYEEPSVDSQKLIELPEGTEINIVEQTEDFLLVRTLDGKEYWVSPEFIPLLWQ